MNITKLDLVVIMYICTVLKCVHRRRTFGSLYVRSANFKSYETHVQHAPTVPVIPGKDLLRHVQFFTVKIHVSMFDCLFETSDFPHVACCKKQ